MPSWCIIQYFQRQKVSLPNVLFNACLEHKISELTVDAWQRNPTEFLKSLKSFISTQGILKEPKVGRKMEKLVLRLTSSISINDNMAKQLYKMLLIITQKLKNNWLTAKLSEKLNEVCESTDFEIVLMLTSFTYWSDTKLKLKYHLFDMINTAEQYIDLPQLYFVVRKTNEPNSAKRTFLINNMKYIIHSYANRQLEVGSYI
jgi:hypothetical protein